MMDAEKLACPKCNGYLYENKCVRCNTIFKNAELHKLWLNKLKNVYDIDKEELKDG
jgi:uncharacterized protein YbaR (Trm112 family)